jgi:hypothetical protein
MARLERRFLKFPEVLNMNFLFMFILMENIAVPSGIARRIVLE